MRLSLLIVSATLAVTGTIFTGCGGDDGDARKAFQSTPETSTESAPKTVNGAVSKCLKDAQKLPNADARKTAKAVCETAKSGNPSKIKDAAREQCLKLTQSLPAGAQRDAAADTCKSSTR